MKYKWLLVFGIAIFGAVSSYLLNNSNESAQKKIFIEGYALGSGYTISISDYSGILPIFQLKKRISAIFQELDRTFSIWRDDSEINLLNNMSSGQWFDVSQEMLDVITKSKIFYKETKGIFEPSILPLIELWGFSKTKISGSPSVDDVLLAKKKVNFNSVVVNNNSIKKDTEGLRLDFSAIVPGYAADKIAEYLQQSQISNFLIDVGGEMRLQGCGPECAGWNVAIESPDNPVKSYQKIKTILNLKSGIALATSGVYRRKKKTGQLIIHHIIDPRTGYSAASDIVSVTVLAKRAVNADAISTALLVMGSHKAIKWLKKHKSYEAYFVMYNGDVLYTDGMKEYFK